MLIEKEKVKNKRHNIDSVRVIFSDENYTLVSEIYKNNKQKLDVICPKGHEWSTRLDAFLGGRRCLECSGLKKHDIDFIRLEFDKRGFTLVSDVYGNNKSELEYICNTHPNEIQTMSYHNLIHGYTCAHCSSSRRLEYSVVKEAFENRGLILISTDYKNNHTKLKYICPEHKEIMQEITYNGLQSGNGCWECGGTKTLTLEQVKWKFDEFGYTLISTEYVNSRTVMQYVCKEHPEKIQEGTYHQLLSGKKCVHCSKKSTGEQIVKSVLDQNEINYVFQYWIKECRNTLPLPFDFAIIDDKNELVCLIEYDGEQHFKPVDFAGRGISWAKEQFEKTKLNDTIKDNFCIQNDIPLFRISYWEKDNIEDILKQILKI